MRQTRIFLSGCAGLGFFVLLFSRGSVQEHVLPLKLERNHVESDEGDVYKSAPSYDHSSTYSLQENEYFSSERPDTHRRICHENQSCFDHLWSDIKKKLCPKMVPQVGLTGTLFSLARDEMGLRQWNSSNAKSIEGFYRNSPGPGFSYTTSKGKTVIYMNTWKAAHETILLWAKRNVRPLEGEFRYKFEVIPVLNDSSKDPCIVTMIRDPVSHFLSGYNEIDTRIMENEYNQTRSRMATAPKALFHRFHYGTKQRFEQFVADILSVPDTLGWTDFLKTEPLHFYSMSATLHLLEKCGVRMTAFLPSMENFSKKWPKFVYKSCPGILPENTTASFHTRSSHESSKDLYGIYKAAKDVWNEGGPTARAICVLHSMDYACWEGLPDGIPVLCKEVYSSTNFVTKILDVKVPSSIHG